MARFWKIHAAIAGHLADGKDDRWINIYQIDEVRPQAPYTRTDQNNKPLTDDEGKPIMVPRCEIFLHHEPYARQHSGHERTSYLTVEMEAADAVAHLEKMLRDDRMLTMAEHEHEPDHEHGAALGHALVTGLDGALAVTIALSDTVKKTVRKIAGSDMLELSAHTLSDHGVKIEALTSGHSNTRQMVSIANNFTGHNLGLRDTGKTLDGYTIRPRSALVLYGSDLKLAWDLTIAKIAA